MRPNPSAAGSPWLDHGNPRLRQRRCGSPPCAPGVPGAALALQRRRLPARPFVAPASARLAREAFSLPDRTGRLASRGADPPEGGGYSDAPGVTQRMLVLSPPAAGHRRADRRHRGLQIFPSGSTSGARTASWSARDSCSRTRASWWPSSMPRRTGSVRLPRGLRQRPAHAADIRAVIGAWLREQSGAPVWLVGTSSRTQSAAYAATELSSRVRTASS